MYQKLSLEVLPSDQRTLIAQISKIEYITLYSVIPYMHFPGRLWSGTEIRCY